MKEFLKAIIDNDSKKVVSLLKSDSSLTNFIFEKDLLYEGQINHWIYNGDTALHLAAAGHRFKIIKTLLSNGIAPNSKANRRNSTPLHYAADGYINGSAWDPKAQVKSIKILIDAGANINDKDNNGATPLHRAVRTRCAAAVKSLLELDSDPNLKNNSGSTPFHLAVQNTGRGGSGDKKAKDAQRDIIKTFLDFNIKTKLQDGNGKTVLDCAKSDWIRELLIGKA